MYLMLVGLGLIHLPPQVLPDLPGQVPDQHHVRGGGQLRGDAGFDLLIMCKL